MVKLGIYFLVTTLIWIQVPGKAARIPMFEAEFEDMVSREPKPMTKYFVLVDAGSTGSTLKVFQVHVNAKGKLTSSKDIVSLKHKLGKVRPGLSSFASDQSGIQDYLKKLIDGAKVLIPSSERDSTPILLMATAGLRILSDQKQKQILSEVRRVFNNKSLCPFKFDDDNAEIISGTQEAVYDWITLNFLKGVFLSTNGSMRTAGSLDLGGTSTQVSFNPFRGRLDKEIVEIADKRYKLYAKSYLKYGTVEIHKRFLEFFRNHREKNYDGYFESPCHHSGLKETFVVDEKNFPVVGVHDVDRCIKIIDQVFFCGDVTKPCPFTKQPALKDVNRNFYAFAAFYYILKRVDAVCGSCSKAEIKVLSIKNAAQNYCNKKYEDISSDKYAKFSCLWSLYIHELFTKGYKMKEDNQVIVLKKMNGFDVNWILGSMLYKLKLL